MCASRAKFQQNNFSQIEKLRLAATSSRSPLHKVAEASKKTDKMNQNKPVKTGVGWGEEGLTYYRFRAL